MLRRVQRVLRVLLVVCACLSAGYAENRPPKFMARGNMLDLIIREDTAVGTQVYQVRASDPDGDTVYYSISGDFFSIDRRSGWVSLVSAVDRETMRSVEVILTLTDDALDGADPNVVSVRRLVPVVDANDNRPVFNAADNGVYRFSVSETAEVGSTVYSKINVTDADFGENGEVSLHCDSVKTEYGCSRFDVRGVELSNGVLIGIVTTKSALDYETEKSFDLNLLAMDKGQPEMTASVRMLISVQDVQDQPPEFVNGPFSATVAENTPPGTAVLDIVARDGDTGIPRHLNLQLVGDDAGYFGLQRPVRDGSGVYSVQLVTGNRTLDRESEDILNNGGLYHFMVLAEEVTSAGVGGDTVLSDVTIVVTDQDDQLPAFNRQFFNVTLPEDIPKGTPLSGLNMVVSDFDQGSAAAFDLRIEDVDNSESVFEVFPRSAQGRAPIQVKVINSSRLDYEREDGRQFTFAVVASQSGKEVSATVTVHVTDANDNTPQLHQDQYNFSVREDASVGVVIGQVEATDSDVGVYGTVRYRLAGFGADKFTVDESSGQLTVGQCAVNRCLDYEDQSSYSLRVVAEDRGNKSTTAAILVTVVDTNDNRPAFVEREYRRILEENSTLFVPSFYVKATDKDEGDNARILYSVIEGNAKGLFVVDPNSGEVTTTQPVTPNPDSHSGRYDLVIEARDLGQPAMSTNVRAAVSVGRDSNEAPSFLPSLYTLTVREDVEPGTALTRVSASDPDGANSDLHYRIHSGAQDNFQMTDSGQILVAPEGSLDLERGGAGLYSLTIHAVDAGSPAKTGVASVIITVDDVNDTPPKLRPAAYVEYVPETAQVGRPAARVLAVDRDTTAELRYSLVAPVTARDRAGITVPVHGTEIQHWFAMNSSSGVIYTNSSLDHSRAAMVVLQVLVSDVRAETEQQTDQGEVTLFIQAFSDNNPVFEPPWLPGHPTVQLTVDEEGQPGSTIFTLRAKDPVSGEAVTEYEEIAGSDEQDWFSVDESVGEIMLNRRLDFDTMNNQNLSVRVRAVSGQRSSQASVFVAVRDINDNYPLFSQKVYETEVSEDSYYPHQILVITARDIDSQNGYGNVTYSLAGTTAGQFQVDPVAGTVHVARGARLDRETLSVHRLRVVAQDNPDGGQQPNRATAQVMVTVLDENDNRPEFTESSYRAVIAENAPIDSSVIRVTAVDRDEGNNGRVVYQLIDQHQTDGLFRLDPVTGQLIVTCDLAGKGRTDPYRLIIRAQDQGAEPLTSDAILEVYIGDVSVNDGIPRFISPEHGESVTVLENLPAGTLVYQSRATDPDDPNSSSGKLQYSFLGADQVTKDDYFQIDSRTGMIVTRRPLDRENQAVHNLLLVASDQGVPPHQSTRSLIVQVGDVDDNRPHFERTADASPREVLLPEEQPPHTVVTTLTAVDQDEGRFGEIHYRIIGGNSDDVFAVSRTNDSRGQLIVTSRVDRESRDTYLVTLQCYSRPGLSPQTDGAVSVPVKYDPEDMSMMQIRIQVLDTDDNPPMFAQPVITTGVKVTTPVRSAVVMLTAVDPDLSPAPVRYRLEDVTFSRRLRLAERDEMLGGLQAFVIDDVTGQLWTNQNMAKYAGGYFDVYVVASSADNAKKSSEAKIRIYVLKESDLMKFVFAKAPGDVKRRLSEFKSRVEQAIPVPVALNLYDTSYQSSSDGRLDYSSTGSCFQMVSEEQIFTADETITLLNSRVNDQLRNVFSQFSVDRIEPCAVSVGGSGYEFSAVEVLIMTVGLVILVGTLLAILVLSCQWRRYQSLQNKQQYVTPSILSASRAPSIPGVSRVPSVMGGSHYGFPPPPPFDEARFAQN